MEGIEARVEERDRCARSSRLPIRLSLFRERLAWGVPQRATLLTPQQDAVNTPREKSVIHKEAPTMPVRLFPRQTNTGNRSMSPLFRYLHSSNKNSLGQASWSSNIRSL